MKVKVVGSENGDRHEKIKITVFMEAGSLFHKVTVLVGKILSVTFGIWRKCGWFISMEVPSHV